MTTLHRDLFLGKSHQEALAIRLTDIKKGEKRPIVKVPQDKLKLPNKLKAHEVLVMVHMTQICDTDVDLGTNPGHGAATTGFKDNDQTPLILNGHESGGVVIATGKKVSNLKVGDWVSLKVREGMKEQKCMMCEADMNHRCFHWQYAPADMEEHGIFRAPGWFCQYTVLPDTQAIKVPKGFPHEYACMGEPLSVGTNALMTAIDRWWGDPGFLEDSKEGPPAIALIGAGGIASIDGPVFSEFPQNIIEAMRTGLIPKNYLDRPYSETRRKMAGMKPKKAGKPEVFYYARTPYKKGLLKADSIKPLGIKYESFEDMGLPYIELVTKAQRKGEKDRVQKIYNLTPLMKGPKRKRFDLVIEMCGNAHQVTRMMLPPSDPGEVEAFLKRDLPKSKEKDRRCEGRYVVPPGSAAEMKAFMQTPAGGMGGLMAPGTKLVISSITGGDEVYPNFPSAKFCWASSLNNADIAGVVNYDAYHSMVGMLSFAMACRKPKLKNWPKKVQEKVVKNPEELLGEGMYDLKWSASGRIGVEMNSMEDIEKTLKVAKAKAKAAKK